MRLEKATIDDCKKLLALAQEDGISVTTDNDFKFAIYILFKGLKKVGFITAISEDQNVSKKTGVIYIKPKYRERGFEKIMVELFTKL